MNRRDKCIPIYGRLTPTGAGSGGSGGGIIPTGTKEININENGESDHDVTDYATAHVTVNVPKPTAKKTVDITANGTTTEDVADFGSVDITVNVQNEKPTGSKAFQFTENGTYSEDVSDIATANITVNVAGQTTDQWKGILEKLVAGDAMSINALTLSVPYVRQSAFYHASLPDTVTLEGASIINKNAFAYASDVKTININSVEDIGENAFNSLSSLDTINAEALKSIATYGINGCSMLRTINAPNVVRVGRYGINNCTLIEELYLPNVTSLYGYAIADLTKLNKVTFGDVQLTSSSFYRCNALQTLDVKTSSSIYIPTSLSKSLIIRDITAVPTMSNTVSELKGTLNVYVPDDLVGAFKAATNWSEFGDRIKPLSEYVAS